MEEEQMLTKEQILDMLDAGQYKELKEELGNMYPVDIAETLEDFEQKPLVMVFRLLAKEEAAETFTYMNSDMREVLIGALTDSELEEVMEEMYLDDTVDVLEEMPANVVDRLLMATDEETRAQINQLLQYPEDSAGSIMNVEYIALRKEMTVEESILKIRQVGLNRETIYTCYVTEKRKLIGRVDVKELLTTGESRIIEEIMDTNVLYAHTTDDQEDVAMMINKYGLIALPIVDHEMCMVGIVTVDDAMLVMQEETTEDISIMAGMSPSEETYFGTSVVEHVKSRLPWLLFLMLSATVTQMIMNSYESSSGQRDTGSCEWNQDHRYGTRRCAHCIIHRWNHDLYRPDCKSRRLYPSDACFQDWTRSCNHGYSAYFYPCRYQYSNRILHDRQPSISFVKTFCI